MRRLVALSIMIALALTACGEKPGGGPPPPVIKAFKVESKDVPWSPEFIGQTAGSLEVEIRARVGGILEQRTYQEGAFVKSGTQLFLIDQEPYDIALQRARAQLAQAQANAERTKLDNDRFSKLFLEKAASEKDKDDARMAYKAALANEQLAKAQVREAVMNLGYTKVTAPIDGMVSKETHSVGTLITTTNSLLTTMVKVNPLHVNFSFPSREYYDISNMIEGGLLTMPDDRGDVQLVKSNGDIYPLKGRIVFIDSKEDPLSATIRAKIEVENPDNGLMPGQYVRIRLTGGMLRNIMLIPQQALVKTPEGYSVYVINSENKSEQRSIELGHVFGSMRQVMSGLKPGELIVVEGIIKINPGREVAINNKEELGLVPAQTSETLGE